jgi:aminoglycoside phosphotransferase family enzyme/predicted kinase
MGGAQQDDVVAFLSEPSSYGPDVQQVELIETHASIVFLAGSRAYKLKRAVRYSYLDYSTPERRQRACETELALNRRTAPSLYLAVSSIGRDGQGKLGFDVETPLDWVVVMRRFEQSDLLGRLADEGRLDRGLARELTDHIVAFHKRADKRHAFGGHAAIAALIDGNDANLRAAPAFDPAKVAALAAASRRELAVVGDVLDRRQRRGLVRRCHGDLHLDNICLLDGHPVLFDCIEFSDELACIDVLYDLAFLLMDLDARERRDIANLVLNRYFDMADGEDGIGAVPLFLSLRAAIRAHVTATAASLKPEGGREPLERVALGHLDRALLYLAKPAPRLVAIGGLSGTGKSTVAAALAPEIGTAPGARILRSDVIRKRLLGCLPEARLPSTAYTPEMGERVYEALRSKAAAALQAGHSVILDAVAAHPAERASFRALAAQARVPFTGFWLEAPPAVLEERIARRIGDASDATAAVLRQQLGYELGPIDWERLDVSRDLPGCVAAARRLLAASDVSG